MIKKQFLSVTAPCREFRTKNLTKFSSDKLLLTYTQSKLFYFDQNATGENLAESDIICTVNIPYIVSVFVYTYMY